MARNLERAFKAYAGLSFWPLAAFLLAMAADLAYLRTGTAQWYETATLAIALGLLGGLIAGAPGAVYYLKAIPRENTDGSKLASVMMVMHVAVLSLFAFNLMLRLVLGPTVAWAVWLGAYLSVFGAVEMAATAGVAWSLWRRRQERRRMTLPQAEHPIQARRR